MEVLHDSSKVRLKRVLPHSGSDFASIPRLMQFTWKERNNLHVLLWKMAMENTVGLCVLT